MISSSEMRAGYKYAFTDQSRLRVQELCEGRGGRPGLSILMTLSISVDVKQH